MLCFTEEALGEDGRQEEDLEQRREREAVDELRSDAVVGKDEAQQPALI